jgi:hypothetical protein
MLRKFGKFEPHKGSRKLLSPERYNLQGRRYEGKNVDGP